jgi:hypothetical protein
MSAPIPRRELHRLAKLCGMFGSDHDGERATAALKADRLVRALGLTWCEVLSPQPNLLASPGQSIPAKIKLLRRHLPMLTEWERGFVISLARFQRISRKQQAVLDRLVAKVSDFERRAA